MIAGSPQVFAAVESTRHFGVHTSPGWGVSRHHKKQVGNAGPQIATLKQWALGLRLAQGSRPDDNTEIEYYSATTCTSCQLA